MHALNQYAGVINLGVCTSIEMLGDCSLFFDKCESTLSTNCNFNGCVYNQKLMPRTSKKLPREVESIAEAADRIWSAAVVPLLVVSPAVVVPHVVVVNQAGLALGSGD